MVIQTKMPIQKPRNPKQSVPSKKEVIFVRAKLSESRGDRRGATLASQSSSVDVIDLGAPTTSPRRRRPRPRRAALSAAPSARRSAPYTPNPRLYPGPAAAPRRWRLPRRPPPPPPPVPACPWAPPSPPAPRDLDTASCAALRLARRRAPAQASASAPASAPGPARGSRLVVTLPAATMEPGTRHSTSPDDCSDGADAASAPSEFLAEFLSAIMRRQYAEALKFCRLILQYEPHNATARGFYPLLRHKLLTHENKRAGAAAGGPAGGPAGGGGSLSSSSGAPRSRSSSHSREYSGERSKPGLGWCGSGSSGGGSVSSQSSLELDSSSGERAAAADDNDATDANDANDATDDNGNDTLHATRSDDLENDNDVSSFKSASSSLRRLRAQFAYSIK